MGLLKSWELLKSWYDLDENAVPPIYVLKPVSQVYPDYSNHSQPELQAEAKQKWLEIQGKMLEIISLAAKKAGSINKLDKSYRYTASVTEQEIWSGILQAPEPEKAPLINYVSLKARDRP